MLKRACQLGSLPDRAIIETQSRPDPLPDGTNSRQPLGRVEIIPALDL